MRTEARHYATDALLRDGSSIHLRAMRSDDKPHLLAFFSRLSPQSMYFRFFQAKATLTEQELQYFTDLDFVRNVALVATRQVGHDEHIIGVGRYMHLDGQETPAPRAEVAFAIADEYQGLGIGTLLPRRRPAPHCKSASKTRMVLRATPNCVPGWPSSIRCTCRTPGSMQSCGGNSARSPNARGRPM